MFESIRSIRLRWFAVPTMALGLFLFAPGCGSDDLQSPEIALDPDTPAVHYHDKIACHISSCPGGPGPTGGTYNGPGDTVPGGTGGGSGGNCSTPPSCGAYNTPANQLTPSWVMSVGRTLTGIWPSQGQLVGYAAVEYHFTVADFQTLMSTATPDADGNYTIVTPNNSNTQEAYFLDYANVGSRAMIFDGTHNTIETLCKGDYTQLLHRYASPPACTTGVGAISLSKQCVQDLLDSVSTVPSDILYVITFLFCSNDI